MTEWEAENNRNKTKSNLFFLPLNSLKTEDSESWETREKVRLKESQVRDSRLNGEMTGSGNTAATKKNNTDLSGSPTEKTFLQIRLN